MDPAPTQVPVCALATGVKHCAWVKSGLTMRFAMRSLISTASSGFISHAVLQRELGNDVPIILRVCGVAQLRKYVLEAPNRMLVACGSPSKKSAKS